MMVRVLGIDPGSRRTGFGVVELESGRAGYVASGSVVASDGTIPRRLATIYRGVDELIREYLPQVVAIEDVFIARNAQSALKLGQARGVAIAAAVAHDLDVHEYAPRNVKRTIVGTGNADKTQVQHMVCRLLNLSGVPSEDASDALAIAMCHAQVCHSGRMPELRGMLRR